MFTCSWPPPRPSSRRAHTGDDSRPSIGDAAARVRPHWAPIPCRPQAARSLHRARAAWRAAR
eukprot:1985699-Prymnesium_polylepis.1